MFEKSRVAKRKAEPLYQALAAQAGHFPKWNFHKYLLDRKGQVVGSFGSSVTPSNGELIDQIESLL
jgi:glutathione peroxidase